MPNRILKESICTSDSIARLSWFEEVLFYRLIVNCDDFGRMDARPAILKSRLFPLRERITFKDIESALMKLADVGCVIMYECDNKPYLYLPAWEVHQSIRAKKSKYPEPKANESNCMHLHANEIKCMQLHADVPVIQSESNPNPNPIREKNPSPPKSPLWGSDPFTAYAGEDAELLDALREFEKMRKAIKRPMTQRAKQLLLTSLDGLSGDRGEKIAILEQSILNNWRGVYALKGGKGEDGRGSSAEKPAGDGKGGDSLRLKGVTYL